MSCCHPFKAFKTGYLTDNGKDDYIIDFSGCCSDYFDVSRAKKPINFGKVVLKEIGGRVYLQNPISVPCGTCIGCRLDKARDWKIRNCLELTYYKNSYFVTLTYDNDHIHFDENGESYYDLRDFQLFMKRLRNCGDFRFFGCAEYGENTYRPHFHLILYGDLPPLRHIGVAKFTSDLVATCWRNGSHLIEPVTPGSIAYVCGYVEKKQKEPDHNFRVRPRLLMSRNPGIGMRYINDHKDVIMNTFKVYGTFGDTSASSVACVPKAFRRKFDGEEWYVKLKEAAALANERIDEIAKIVYKSPSIEIAHDRMEEGYYSKLKNKRGDTL